MRLKIFRAGWAVVILASVGSGTVAWAGGGTDAGTTLPDVLITSSRLDVGVSGASISVITAAEIADSPGQTLADILAREAGVQVQDLFGGVDGADATIDLRGFGAAATPNTLILLNGHRLNDYDLSAVNLAAIPKDSIARIEIIRGNAGAVLYGDGAVGGVINIITKSRIDQPPFAQASQTLGSFDYRRTGLSVGDTFAGTALSAYGDNISSDGYRQNNRVSQHDIVGSIDRALAGGEVYLDASATSQHIGLPGALSGAELAADPRATDTPLDNAGDQELNTTLGGVWPVASGVDLVLDAGVRHKDQQSRFFEYGDTFYDTSLTRLSLAPRVDFTRPLLTLPARTIAGIDLEQTEYHANQQVDPGNPPIHRYDIRQRTAAAYWQSTLSVRPGTAVSLGLRLQDDRVEAHDVYDPTAPNNGNFVTVQGVPLAHSSLQYAFDLGLDHHLQHGVELFARVGRSFRLPTADERVGESPWGVPTTFDLKTQTSVDGEAGMRLHRGAFALQSSVYLMKLHNELHFNPLTYTNVNLGPTRRYGVENSINWEASRTVRARAGLSYARARFASGPWNGNDVPLVSRWTGYGGLTWALLGRRAVLDADVLYVGSRRFDNDQPNVQPLIPEHTLVDLGVGGTVGKVRYSLAVRNVFDRRYFDYGVASTFTYGVYNAYPMPGRTIKGQIGVRF